MSLFRSAAFRVRRDQGLALGEEFLFLELDSLPGRVAQHDVEAPSRKDVRKRQLPVEEAVVLGDAPCGVDEHRGRRHVLVSEREPRGCGGRGFDDRTGSVLGPEEGGAPRVGHELLVLVRMRGQERVPTFGASPPRRRRRCPGPARLRAWRRAGTPVSIRGSNARRR